MATALDHVLNSSDPHGVGFKSRVYVCIQEENLTNGEILPETQANANRITADIAFKPAVAANSAVTPAIQAQPGGACIQIDITSKGTALKMNEKADGDTFFCVPTLDCKHTHCTAEKDKTLSKLSGRNLFMCYEDSSGLKQVATNVRLVSWAKTIDDNTNSYTLKFDFGNRALPPAYYTGTLQIKPFA